MGAVGASGEGTGRDVKVSRVAWASPWPAAKAHVARKRPALWARSRANRTFRPWGRQGRSKRMVRFPCRRRHRFFGLRYQRLLCKGFGKACGDGRRYRSGDRGQSLPGWRRAAPD